MKKKFYSLLIILFFSTVYAESFTLNGVMNDKSETSKIGKNTVISYKTQDDVHISVVGKYISDEKLIRYVVTIANKGNKVFDFKENMISIYQGNSDLNSWYPANYFSATAYYNKKLMEQHNTDNAVAAAEIGLAILDIVTDIHSGRNYGRYGHRRYSNSYHNHHPILEIAGAIVGIGVTAAVLSSILDDKDYTPEHLKNTLLYDRKINPGETYTGYFMGTAEKFPDYKVRFSLGSDENPEFTFQRSDRTEIINPWSDPVSAKHSLVVGMNIPVNQFDFAYIYGGQPVGLYLAGAISNTFWGDAQGKLNWDGTISLFEKSTYYSLSYGNPFFFSDGLKSENLYEVSCGITIKAFPHSWIMAGCGFDFNVNYYYGHMEYKNIYNTTNSAYGIWVQGLGADIYYKPQLGLNLVFNALDFGGMVSYRIGNGRKSGFQFDLFAGLAF